MRIGQLAQAAGTTAKTLRFYEDQGLLLPAARTGSGYREYGTETLARLDFIHRGQAAGLTLAQIRQILQIRDTGTAPCEHVRELLDTRLAEVDEQIAELKRRVELTPFSREEFDASYSEPVDDIDAAHKTIVRSFMGHGSDSATRSCRTGFRAKCHSRALPSIEWGKWPDAIPAFTNRLRDRKSVV